MGIARFVRPAVFLAGSIGVAAGTEENSEGGFCGGVCRSECKNCDSRRCSEPVAITPKRRSEWSEVTPVRPTLQKTMMRNGEE